MASVLKLEEIKVNGGTQSRAAISDTYVAELMDDVDSPEMPPVKVMWDAKEQTHWLWDGFHRMEAHRRKGKTEIRVIITCGNRRDAVLASLGANGQHGLRRTREDKRKCVLTIMSDPEWRIWENTRIAKACCVSESLVRTLRGDPEKEASFKRSQIGDSSAPSIPEELKQEAESIVSAGGDPRLVHNQHGTSVTDASARKRSPSKAESSPQPTDPAPLHFTAEDAEVIEAEMDAEEIASRPAWHDFNAAFDEDIALLEEMADRWRERLDYDSETKQLREKFASGFSYAGTVGQIHALIRTIRDALPAELSDKSPGFLTARQSASRSKSKSAA